MKLIIARLELKVEDFEVEPAIEIIRAASSAGGAGNGNDAKITVLPWQEPEPTLLKSVPSPFNGQQALCAT